MNNWLVKYFCDLCGIYLCYICTLQLLFSKLIETLDTIIYSQKTTKASKYFPELLYTLYTYTAGGSIELKCFDVGGRVARAA